MSTQPPVINTIIQCFLACSTSLVEERDCYGKFVTQLNEEVFLSRGIYVKYKACEMMDPANKGKDKQAEYDDIIRNSDLFIGLFKKDAGDYTIHECNLAIETSERNGNPRYLIYNGKLEKGDKPTEKLKTFIESLKNYIGLDGKPHLITLQEYENTDKLKLDFIMQMFYILNEKGYNTDLAINGSEAVFEGISVASLDKVPFTANNKYYEGLKSRLGNLGNEIADLKSVPSNETIKKIMEEKEVERYQLYEEIKNFEKDLFETAKTIASYQGKESSARLNQAITLFNEGDNKGADALLNIQEINSDAEEDVKMYNAGKETMEAGKSGVLQRIEEYRLKAKTVLTVYDNENRIAEADEAYSKAVELAKEINMLEKDYLDLIMEYGRFLDDYAFYDKSLQIWKECLRLSIKLNVEDSQYIASCYNNLGNVCAKKGEYEKALENHEKDLEITRKILGENHPDTATSYNNLGNVYYKKGEYEKALENYKKALKIQRKVLGENHPDTASCYNNLGIVYGDMSDYDKALENHEKSLEIKKKVLGENHPDTASCYNNLGNVYANEGKYDKALENHEKSLAITRKVFGENHPDTATSYNNLGNVYDEMGEYEKALENHEKSLAITRKVFGENHPDTAMSYNNLGNVYDEMGEYDKALKNHEKSLEIKSKVLGENHPGTAASNNNLGNVYQSMGEYEKALENYKKALKIYKKILGENHPNTAMSYGSLGNLYNTIGKYKEAEQNYAVALSIFERTLGPMHPYTCQTCWNLGLLYGNRFNDMEKATEYMVKAAVGGLPQAIEWLKENGIE